MEGCDEWAMDDGRWAIGQTRMVNVFLCRLSVFGRGRRIFAGAREIFVSRGKSRVGGWEIFDGISGLGGLAGFDFGRTIIFGVNFVNGRTCDGNVD